LPLKYKCLILDHDDTAVDSTSHIHHPAHLEAMKILRPGLKPLDLKGWFLINFDPGIMTYLTEELNLTSSELEEEFNIWRSFTSSRIPHFYPGFLELLHRYRKEGGLLAVVSHSQEDLIRRDYTHNTASLSTAGLMITVRENPVPGRYSRFLRNLICARKMC